jgi:hypothetical protein
MFFTRNDLLRPMFDYIKKMAMGISAFTVQFYNEVNKKRGLEWEASRSIVLTNVGDKVYSIVSVGAEYVDLKSRILGATGGGVVGRAYRISASDITLGIPDKWHNYNSAISGQPLTGLYAGSEITFITPVVDLAVEANKLHADIFAITNVQNQGKGFTPTTFGGNHILNPNDVVLLEIESFDSSQTATAKIDIYEGGLDFYPE